MKNAYQHVVCIEGQSLGEILGITPDEIKNIVHNFYAKVQKDNILGPIFEKEMSEDWDHHLSKMCNFWTTIMFAKPLYKGNPLEVHSRVEGISSAHFDHWLALFKQSLLEECPNAEHVDVFYQRAGNMARVMTGALSLKHNLQ